MVFCGIWSKNPKKLRRLEWERGNGWYRREDGVDVKKDREKVAGAHSRRDDKE